MLTFDFCISAMFTNYWWRPILKGTTPQFFHPIGLLTMSNEHWIARLTGDRRISFLATLILLVCINHGKTGIHFTLKRGVNPEFLKFINCCNFWIFTMTYIKVYIFGKEMSHRIYFWCQISPKMLIFWENHKKSHFWLKIFVTS